ncbi:hypothetical protein C8J57DRAFT_1085595 [Mycena rebaudengoi]|nr:hypothetical protein C8J57DRAFT_1085595 [Mycena rebaudengoi]
MIRVSTIVLAVIGNIISVPAAAAVIAFARNSTDAKALAAPFAINLGTQGNNDVVWVSGDSQCNNVIIGPNGANNCGRPFSINGVDDLTFQGCPSAALSIDQGPNLFAKCSSFSEPEFCGVISLFHCV